MDIDQIAQRLEEISVETDNNELLALAEELGRAEDAITGKRCPTCEQAEEYRRTLEHMAHLLHRAGITINRDQFYSEERFRAQQRIDYMRYSHFAPSPEAMARIVHGSGI